MRRVDFTLSFLIENFFSEYLVQQRKVSPHTISSYRDTFRLLLLFASREKKLADLCLEDLGVEVILAFLSHLEKERGCGARSRNQRLAAIKSFFGHANVKIPDKANLIHRVMALSTKNTDDEIVDFLSLEEQAAILAAPDRSTWLGRRDHMLILFGIETGLRVSELLGVRPKDLVLAQHPNVYCMGKGRKERRVPLGRATLLSLREWLKEPMTDQRIFAARTGDAMTADNVQAMLKKYQVIAEGKCPSLKEKRVSPHVLRHTTAMNLLQADVDPSVIALWLGHSSMDTTMKCYITANLVLKEKALAKTASPASPYRRYKPANDILSYLEGL